MESADQLIDTARLALARPIKLAHQASAIAMVLHRLAMLYGHAADPCVVELGARFNERLHEAGFDDLLGHQIRYAIRLASAPGDLEYEEMHKLLSLCDEVHALRSLGFSVVPALVQDFEAGVRARFAGQPRHARLAAQDKVEGWNRQLWWYAENLTSEIR